MPVSSFTLRCGSQPSWKMATMCLNLNLNTRHSANVADLEPGGGLCSCTEYAYREYFLSSDVCNIELYLQLYFCCFSNVQAEITNLFCNGNNMSQSTCSDSCRVSRLLRTTKTTKMAFHSTAFIHKCGAFAECIAYCGKTSCNHS